ncbi:MAG: hypothetical protein IJ877_01410 [Candidatus Gastranaerophilales bacterium]|nr:hypothetical protein [Candidatus Gastranaerophilales bacterium]
MKRYIAILLVLSQFTPFILASDVINLDKVEEFDVQYKEQVQTLKGSLFVDDTLEAQNKINEIQRADLEDIENLWNATVSNNPMIGFCLKKLSIPAEQRRIHSSFFAKSMSAIISGAALLPSFLGMNYGVQSGAYTAGKLATSLINKQNNDKLQNPALTDTEAIELASLVEDLQDEIIVSYYKYKGALTKLKKCREQILLHNKNYSEALEKNDSLDISITSSQWEEELIEEYRLKQEAKKYQLALTRLAGKKTVNELHVAQLDLTVQNIDPNELNYEKRTVQVELPKGEEK